MTRIFGDQGHRSRRICILVAGLGAIASVLLRQHVPVFLLPPSQASYDDGLFLQHGSALAGHHWLGTFDQLTLAKGMAFPALIALMHGLRLPLMLGIQLTVLAAGAALAASIWLATRRDWLATAVFLVVALDPMNFSLSASRVIRDDWYAALSVLLVSLAFLTAFAARDRRRVLPALGLAALTGLTAATFWLCREEGPWIVPSLLVVLVAWPLAAYLRRRRAGDPGGAPNNPVQRRLRLALIMATGAAAAILPIGVVRAENSSHYGLAATNDMTTGNIARAYADWTRVRAGPTLARVPFDAEQRLAVYRVSPAANELQASIEASDNPWFHAACVQKSGCGDLGGGVAVWALRDAAAHAGHFTSETAAQDFFGRLDDEINAACDDGRLSCAAQLPIALQPLQRASASALASSFAGGLGDLFGASDLYQRVTSVPQVEQAERDQARGMLAGIPATQETANQQVVSYANGDWVYDLLNLLYRLGLPLLTAGALTGLALGIRGRFRATAALGALTLAFAVAVLGRLALLAIIDATEFDALAAPYEFPASACLLAFACAGCALLYETLSAAPRPSQPGSG